MSRDTRTTTYGRRSILKATGALAAGAAVGTAGMGSASADGTTSLSLDLPVRPLETGHYEGWAIFGSEKVSTGKFSAEDEMVFDVERDLSNADEIVVTIEPEGDTDDVPSGIVYAAGPVRNGRARLSFPVDFPSDLTGTYILATPSNGGDSDETSGVWFVDPRGGPSPGLADLPDLPDGWVYEGWAVSGGRPISTGRFDDPTAPDDFDGYSGDESVPPLPGEDLLENAPEGVEFPVDLADGMSKVVVSVEPDVDGVDPTGSKPFQIKPLVADVPAGMDDHTPGTLTANLGSVPDGRAIVFEAGEPLTRLRLDMEFPELDAGFYRAWAGFLSDESERVHSDRFAGGDSPVFEFDRDLRHADVVYVTIEPEDGAPGEGSVVYAAGAVGGHTVDLTFPTSFPSDISGTYILATPSNGGDSDETSGVWFLDPRGGPSPGLADLPELPSGWTYEGWAVTDGRPISTGRFDDPAAPDDFDGYSGDESVPPLPGEDLLENAPEGVEFPVDLADGMSKVVVSVEPDVDGVDPTGPAPFSIKPLVADVPADLDDHTPASMGANTRTVPGGQARLMPAAPSLSDYENDEGVVTRDGLQRAVSDWVAGRISEELLNDVVEAWVAG